MEIQLKNIPQCFIHKREILYICSCGACQLPNPMICGDPQCMKPHSHPMQQIVSITKLAELFQKNTASMKLLIKKTQQYYRQIRESICHEIQKISDMMSNSLMYKHTHPVISLFKQQRYNQINPQKMVQLLSYLRGAKTERKSMEFIKDEVCQVLDKLQTQRKKLFESAQFKKLMITDLIDANNSFEMKMDNVNTSTLDNEGEFSLIIKMLQGRTKKSITTWNLLYRASEHEFSADSYLMSIQGRGPFLMIFKTEKGKKFGCYLNCKADKKEGWLTDGPGFSFIFSVDNDIMFPIRQQAKFRVKCMYIGDKGPQIGCGCDIYISNKCNQNNGSGSNLGGSFEVPPSLPYGSSKAKQFLAGEQRFTLIQYQVYEIK